MEYEKILYQSYNRRKLMMNAFLVFGWLLAALFFVAIFMETLPAIEDLHAGRIQEINFKHIGPLLLFGVGLTVFIRVFFCGSIKRGLKKAKPKIDYLMRCVAKLDSLQQHTLRVETDEFFKGWSSRSKLHFGRNCVYGMSVCTSLKELNYHVILPYANIKQVILHQSFEKDVKQIVSEIASIASVAITVVGLLSGTGMGLLWSVKYAVFILVDDGDNYHVMSCGLNSRATHEAITRYVGQIVQRAPQVQIGYITRNRPAAPYARATRS
jgi:hypothetical protein